MARSAWACLMRATALTSLSVGHSSVERLEAILTGILSTPLHVSMDSLKALFNGIIAELSDRCIAALDGFRQQHQTKT